MRRYLNAGQREWELWQAGFDILVEACDDPPIDTMAELLAFWQDVGILVADGNEAGEPIWMLPAFPPSPWRVVYVRGQLVRSHQLAAALDWLLECDVPRDPDLPGCVRGSGVRV